MVLVYIHLGLSQDKDTWSGEITYRIKVQIGTTTLTGGLQTNVNLHSKEVEKCHN